MFEIIGIFNLNSEREKHFLKQNMYFLTFFLQATTYIGTIEMPIGTKNLDTKPAVGTS